MEYQDLFKIEKEGHISWLILNRPEKRNMMNADFLEGLAHYFQAFDQDPETRVVVIRAEGKSFTAGMDVGVLSSALADPAAGARENFRKLVLKWQDSVSAIEKCRKPVIAAIHSHCIGGGLDMISACDIRLASQDAVFSIRETKVAIVADLGSLQRLPHIIGPGWFRELALTGRDFTAEDALKIGLITHLCEDREQLLEESRQVALEIADCSPLTVQGVKDSILYNRDNGIYPGLEYVAQKNAALLPNDDLTEALTAFMEKRQPVFGDK